MLIGLRWLKMKVIKLTLCLITDGDRILLGHKKRGFGEGLYNGFGGKVEDHETIEEAVHRELEEEAAVRVNKITAAGIINFGFDDVPNEVLEVHIYRGEGIEGEPYETDEMRPEWFSIKSIPYEGMWPDDKFWIPIFLEGKQFEGEFNFDKDRNITKHVLTVVGEENRYLFDGLNA